jgi:hypothetical protein
MWSADAIADLCCWFSLVTASPLSQIAEYAPSIVPEAGAPVNHEAAQGYTKNVGIEVCREITEVVGAKTSKLAT